MKDAIEQIFGADSYAGKAKDDLLIFWKLTRPHLIRLIAAGVCSLILSGINGAIAWSIKPAWDYIFVEKQQEYLYLLPFGIVLLFTARGAFAYFNNYLMSSIGAKIVRDMRQSIYNKLMRLPMAFHANTSSGNVVSKVLNDVNMFHGAVAYTIKDFLVESASVIVLAGVAVYRKWDLALLSFVVIPLIVGTIAHFGSRMKKTGMQTRILIARVTTLLNESLQGMKIIKAFTMEPKMSDRYSSALVDHYRNSMRETRINEFSTLFSEILGGVGIGIIFFYGGYLVVQGEISSGDFFSFIAAMLMLYTPLRRLSRVNNSFQQGRNVITRVREIVSVPDERQTGTDMTVQGRITFDNVTFRYPSAQDDALRNISCDIRPGEIVALVGYSGAGKSTFADLVAGFWSPTSGRILVDGQDAAELSLRSLRSHIGAVTQDVFLFDDTVRANILVGKPGSTEAEVEEAAKAAFAHEFILEMPDKYDTMIGERGVRLSGGQKQRITIARAILRNPAVLILDEATSSLDIESEHKVQQALETLMVGRTTIVIAHRLSTIQKASRIFVMSNGNIIQEGTHDFLMTQSGLYRELYAMQFRTDDAEADYTRQ